MNDRFDFNRELNRLDELILDKNGVKILHNPEDYSKSEESKAEFYSLEKFVDITVFKEWKARGTCINCEDLRSTLNIDDILEDTEPQQEDILTYLEYVANLFMLFKKYPVLDEFTISGTAITTTAKKNLSTILSWLNYEVNEFENEEKALVVEKDAATTAVAEIVESQLAYKIVQYNHFTLKGDIATKKAILLTLGSELEPKRKLLSQINKQLSESIFYILNNLDIRHNNRNKKAKNYNEAVNKMPKKKIEEWYDELYQMCLLAFLELDQVDRNKRFEILKNQIEIGVQVNG